MFMLIMMNIMFMVTRKIPYQGGFLVNGSLNISRIIVFTNTRDFYLDCTAEKIDQHSCTITLAGYILGLSLHAFHQYIRNDFENSNGLQRTVNLIVQSSEIQITSNITNIRPEIVRIQLFMTENKRPTGNICC